MDDIQTLGLRALAVWWSREAPGAAALDLLACFRGCFTATTFKTFCAGARLAGRG